MTFIPGYLTIGEYLNHNYSPFTFSSGRVIGQYHEALL